MREINHLEVKIGDRVVGTIAETKHGLCAFQYSKEWLAEGFPVSPFSLPLREEVFLPKSDILEGLFGVFSDSLPDGWGRLLMDRMLMQRKISPRTIRPIQRLGIIGAAGMGALEYYPELLTLTEQEKRNFDELAEECKKIMSEEECRDLDILFQMGGSPGGARPKVLVKHNEESWLVKFPSLDDKVNVGEEEYRYMKCAKECGIQVPEVALFPSQSGRAYFGVKRFDREQNRKIHMITVSGLLETSHRIPNMDYHDLMKLTYLLTKDFRQMEELYRRMCFNVYSHNRDDHSKNFSYLYDEAEDRWSLSPAYDLTYSNSIGGEHATCINGNGSNPTMKDLIEVGKATGMSEKKLKTIAEEIGEKVANMLCL